MRKALQILREPLVWGYALLLVFFALFTGRVNPLFFGPDFGAVFPRYAHAAEVGQFCMLVGIALAARFGRMDVGRALLPLTAVMLGGGYATTLALSLGVNPGEWFPMLAGALFGMGQGACFMGWLTVYAGVGPAVTVSRMTVSTLVSAVLIIAIEQAGSAPVLFGLLAVIVILACVGLGAAVGGDAVGSRDIAQDQVVSLPALGTEFRSILCLIAIAIVCGAQRVVSFDGPIPAWSIELIFPLGYVLGALAFYAAMRRIASRGVVRATDLGRIYPALLIVMATCGVLGAFANTGMQVALYAMDNIAFTIVSMCMVLTALLIGTPGEKSTLFACGAVCGSVYFAIQLGRIICEFIFARLGASAPAIMIVSIIAVYVIALAAISSGVFAAKGVTLEHSSASISGIVDGREGTEFIGDASGETRAPSAQAIASVSVAQIFQVSEDAIRSNPVYRDRYGLTEREIDMAVLVLKGYNATEMAQMLELSVNTVKTHLKKLYSKMDVHNRRELGEVVGQIEKGAVNVGR